MSNKTDDKDNNSNRLVMIRNFIVKTHKICPPRSSYIKKLRLKFSK